MFSTQHPKSKIQTVIAQDKYQEITKELNERNVVLVAVSKTKPVEDIKALYDLGQKDFGENYVQELAEKQTQLPNDIRWHFIGHLQGNKVKYIAPFIHLIHGVDSLRLLKEIDKQALKNNRVIDCLLQVHIAQEETKFGLDENELSEIIGGRFDNARICGLMGMASFTANIETITKEFHYLKQLFDRYTASFATPNPILSMGMSADYRIAIDEGSNLVRIGSLLFGARS
jgi:pyridoxal phosphate enzyme (YggS family)